MYQSSQSERRSRDSSTKQAGIASLEWSGRDWAPTQYRREPDGGHVPWALQVVELRDDRIEAIHAFLDTEAFERFGFPSRLD